MSPRAGLNILTAAWLVCWVTGFVLTHIPIEPKGPVRIPHLDKFAHIALFVLITFLGAMRIRAKRSLTTASLAFWAIAYLVYAAADELTQPLTGREADLADWVCDAIGIGIGTWTIWVRGKPKNGHEGMRGM